MITITNLSMAYGQRILFDEVNLMLAHGKRYGLVGANGTGKSTLLRVLAGEEEPTEGSFSYPKQMRMGWLRQDQFRYDQELVLNVVLRGKKVLWNALEEKERISKKATISADDGYRLSDLEEIIAHYDGYAAESVAQRLLSGLGITEEQQFDTLSALSGGYKLRVLLAQALFDNPDILILDEPNNYLDVRSIAWLEEYLTTTFAGLLIFTSHDQSFLNTVATHILDIDYGEVREYVGNYDSFLKQKQLVVEQKLHERSYMEKKIARLKVFVERFGAKATKAAQAKSREKTIEKMELQMPDIEKTSRRTPHITFTMGASSGKQVLKVHGITKSFGSKNVLRGVSFTVNKGEKVAIMGPNGVGKSTLLNIVVGRLAADRGSYEWGYNTSVSYFAQEHHEMAHDASTVYDWLCHNTTDIPSSMIRHMLGSYLFQQDDIYKKVSCLSGGEISRLISARITLEKRNVLVFDEPTNHFDIEARTQLAHALKEYQGTVLVVSHDRYFVSQVASRIIAITPERIIDVQGSYDEYHALMAEHMQ